MASIIRVKRSTGVVAPASLNFGELGLTVGVGTYGNKGGRLFAGDNAQNAQVVGGRYYTDLLSADELFFTGTATEVIGVVSVDNSNIGNGSPGDVTNAIRKKYLEIVNGNDANSDNYLTLVK